MCSYLCCTHVAFRKERDKRPIGPSCAGARLIKTTIYLAGDYRYDRPATHGLAVFESKADPLTYDSLAVVEVLASATTAVATRT